MKKLTATPQAINFATKHLLDRPGTWAAAETGKMVTRWDDELKFECESNNGIFYTDSVLEAVEWLYLANDDEEESYSFDQEWYEKQIDKAEKRGKREALEKIKNHHSRNASYFERKSLQGKDEHDSMVRQVEHEFSMEYIDRIIEEENLEY